MEKLDLSDLNNLSNLSTEAIDSMLNSSDSSSSSSSNISNASSDMDAAIKAGLEELSKEEAAAPASESSQNQSKEVSSQEESKYKVKVDGQEVEVPLQDLLNSYSGNKAVEKRFTELDKEKKSLQAQIKEIENFNNELASTMRDKGVLEGVLKLGEMNNIAPHLVKEALMKELLPEIIRLQELSEEQKQFEREKADLEYKTKVQASKLSKYEQEQANKELFSKINEVKASNSISDEEWTSTFSSLDSQLPKEQPITLDMVRDQILSNRAYSKAEVALKSFENGNYAKDSNVVSQLQNILLRNPDFDDADIKDILSSALGVKSAVIEGAANSGSSKSEKTDSKSSDSWDIKEMSWEDIINL